MLKDQSNWRGVAINVFTYNGNTSKACELWRVNVNLTLCKRECESLLYTNSTASHNLQWFNYCHCKWDLTGDLKHCAVLISSRCCYSVIGCAACDIQFCVCRSLHVCSPIGFWNVSPQYTVRSSLKWLMPGFFFFLQITLIRHSHIICKV